MSFKYLSWFALNKLKDVSSLFSNNDDNLTLIDISPLSDYIAFSDLLFSFLEREFKACKIVFTHS